MREISTFIPLLLSQRNSLNLPMAGRQHGCQRARMPVKARITVKGGEREAQAFVGKQNKEVRKRKESNTHSRTSTGLLQLGP